MAQASISYRHCRCRSGRADLTKAVRHRSGRPPSMSSSYTAESTPSLRSAEREPVVASRLVGRDEGLEPHLLGGDVGRASDDGHDREEVQLDAIEFELQVDDRSRRCAVVGGVEDSAASRSRCTSGCDCRCATSSRVTGLTRFPPASHPLSAPQFRPKRPFSHAPRGRWEGMPDTLIYVLTNETRGIVSRHESLNSALDAVNEEVANREEWVIELWSHGRPLRWVAEGLGHTRADDDIPTRARRGTVAQRG